MTDYSLPTKIMRSTVLKLTLTYLSIMMIMSLIFSFVIYRTSVIQLRKQPPVRSLGLGRIKEVPKQKLDELEDVFAKQAREVEQQIFVRLVWLNIFVVIGGGIISYVLARKTLAPIEYAIESQTRFVSDASHELRTPLTVIQTMNEVALRQPKLSVSEAKDVIKQNVEEAAKLRILSDNLLGLLKQNSTNPKISEFSVIDAVDEAISQVSVMAQKSSISLQSTVDSTIISSDKTLIVQLLVILLDNAIKYSPENSSVTVSSQRRGEKYAIEIQDNGVGISPRDQAHIFDRFYRVDQSRGKTHKNGYGLGLSIAKRLADQLDVEIKLKSSPNKGSKFSLHFKGVKQTTS
ncbi:HAMP domain-containing histidine kinase [Candidatus Saccharibacteria bacterium]|nr:HAMP domain-containing histidine kinase [Candidatus Saccharibacteria bacterium]